MLNFKKFLEEKRGLWDNIHAKRKRIKAGSGEHMRRPGEKGRPTAADFKAANEEVELDETVKLGSKVKIHAPGKDYHDQIGHVGEIRHGAYKSAPKTYTVDYAGNKSVQLDKKNIKIHSEEVELDEIVEQSNSSKTGIYQTDVYGTSAYHAKCLEPNCDWESKRYDTIKQAQHAVKKHAEKHFDKKKRMAEQLSADEKFDLIEEMVIEIAEQHNLDPELVWEKFEDVEDEKLYEYAIDKKGYKSSTGGLTQKGVDAYNRKTGGHLQTAVTTKPSKLKPGSKAANRRKSFCARMGGVKGPMKDEKGRPTRKALALRKWNC